MTSAPRVRLRALEAGDLERVHRWQNDPGLYEHLVGRWRPVPLEVARDWLARTAPPRPDAVAFAVVDGEQHVGNGYLRDIDPEAGHAELHVLLGEPAARGRGVGTAAVGLLLDHAFGDLGLRRVWLEVLDGNAAARRTYLRLGFREEGVLRAHAWKGGRAHDVVVMGLLREERP